jgi:hypothetical protein
VERPDIEDSKCIEEVTCSVRLKVPSRSSGHTYMEVYDDIGRTYQHECYTNQG